MEYLNEYKICRADSVEWARYHAIYRLTNFNEWMSLSFQSDINRYAKTNFCYWVTLDNKLQYIATQSYEFQVSSVQVFFDHIKLMNVTNEWSTLVYDNVTKKFIGACTVSLVNDLPYILDFVVHPDFQRKGLASMMMQRTLKLFFNNYPAIRLNITEGNDAEVFYDKLGFISLARKGYMSKLI